MISVMILTKNEEHNLPECLESVSWSDDIHVFDSHSSDRTAEIAERFGATVTQRQFDNWSAHQNWGLRNLPFQHPWVFYCDADERVSPALAIAMREAVEKRLDAAAYRVQRRDYFLGRWLRHVQATSSYIRLFRPEAITYERLVNPVTLVDGTIGDLDGHLDHFPFSKGIDNWFERHNSYSRMEAQQIATDRDANKSFSLLDAFFSKNPQERRRNQKELFYRLPQRSWIQFFILYVLKRGFLDGRAGFMYARMRATYEAMIEIKLAELRRSTLANPVFAGSLGFD
jgi:glycosyltransferase involved in cell wall biosynthesis